MNDHRPGRGNPTREQNPAYGLLQPIYGYTKKNRQDYVDDQQLWDTGTVRLKELLETLPAAFRPTLTSLLNRYRKAKEAAAAVVAEVNAASVCRQCGGQCCLNGKYRINILDALARYAAHIQTRADFTLKPVCPYGSDAGCTMEPGLRPVDCVLFICDAIDCTLSSQSKNILAAQELVLRGCIREASRLTGENMGTPLLLWAGKNDDKFKPKA